MSIKMKADPRIGLIGLTPEQVTLFEECFKQFRVQSVIISADAAQQLHREKFEGAVLRLNGNAEETLKAARTSPSNKRMMIFAICQNSKEVMPYAHYGINAVFEEPLSRQTVVKVVRATYLLILNEYRKYLRIPIVLPIQLESGDTSHMGSSCELSAGGMSLTIPALAEFKEGETWTVAFTLPESPALRMSATVCWVRKAVSTIGLQFEEDQPDRDRVRKWIDDYLGLK